MVVVLDGVRALRAQPGVPRLLREGPDRGIYAIGLDHDPSRLAEEGRAEVAFEADGLTATVKVDGHDPVEGVLVDQVEPGVGRPAGPPAWRPFAMPAARRAARSFRRRCASSTWSALISITRAGWSTVGAPEGRTTLAPVGVSIDGTFYLDLERDGPHALVAGTTGSGKSEFLQTLVASLALANRPDAIQFVLVDYKGASAFADCAELPHTVGLVTNLDGRETQRALASLDAELRRREACLHQLRAADVNTAWEHDPEQAGAMGLARLVLVIDEFAELVHELPDFVTGLIRIARVGRSLGVHLILATQRPAGVVTGEMRANTGLRVALRMEDPGDSLEVLESSDAAGISRSTPGRAYRPHGRRGPDRRLPGGPRRRAEKGGERRAAPPSGSCRSRGPGSATRSGSGPSRTSSRGRATDLHALVELMAKAAEEAGIPPGRSPWMEPLPAVVGLDQLPPGHRGDGPGPVAYGLEDRPAEQSQRAAVFDLADGAHLAVAGAARSGRSTLLRTLAASLARSVSPDDVHLYGLDFGNGALLPLASLPHCGAVVMRSEGERMERLVGRLLDEIARRQELMAQQGFGDVAEQRAAVGPDERLPYLVLFLDRWEGFMSAYPVESGSRHAGRPGPADPGRARSRAAGGAQRRPRPAHRPPGRPDRRPPGPAPQRPGRLPAGRHQPQGGRGRRPAGPGLRADSGIELQVAVLARRRRLDPSGQAQAEAVRVIAARPPQRWPGPRIHRPIRVDTMPAIHHHRRGRRPGRRPAVRMLPEPARPAACGWSSGWAATS